MEKFDQQGPKKPAKTSKEQAIDEIRERLGEIYMMGANDYEIPTINRILEMLENDEIDPEKAVEEVFKIGNLKSDYH